MLCNIDFLTPKFSRTDRVNLNKWTKIYFYVVFFLQIQVWRFAGFWFRLRNKYLLDLQLYKY